jgi:hypothetical protein
MEARTVSSNDPAKGRRCMGEGIFKPRPARRVDWLGVSQDRFMSF